MYGVDYSHLSSSPAHRFEVGDLFSQRPARMLRHAFLSAVGSYYRLSLFSSSDILFASHHATSLVARCHLQDQLAQQFTHIFWWHHATTPWLRVATRSWMHHAASNPSFRIGEAVPIRDAHLPGDSDKAPLFQNVDGPHAGRSVQAGLGRERVEGWPALTSTSPYRNLVAVPCEHGENVSGAWRQGILGKRHHRTQKRRAQQGWRALAEAGTNQPGRLMRA